MALEEWIERFKDNIVNISTFAAGVSILACFASSIGLFAQSGHHLVGVYTLFVGLLVLSLEFGLPVLNRMTLDEGTILHTLSDKAATMNLTPVKRGIIYGVVSVGTFISMTAAALAGICLALTCLLHVAQYKTTEDPGLSIAADRVNRPVAGRGPEGYDVLQDEDLLLP